MLSGFFINRPKFALVISIVFLLAGGISINLIPIAEFPDITPPQVQVTTTYPGASAEVVEQSVASPIEAQVNGVDGMLYMSSTSSNSGSYELTITFEVGTDPDIAAVNVQNRVTIANAQLPQEVRDQGVITQKQSANMLLVINLSSPESTHDALFLSNYASIYMQDRLARIDGVGSVAQFGALDYGMRIWMDPERLTSLGLTTADVANAIESQNIQASAGQLGAPPFEGTPPFQYTLQAKGRLVSIEEFENIIIRAEADGSFVRLRDIARVELGSQTYNAVSKLNNQPGASIAVYQSPGANALSVADQIYAELDQMAESFPPDVTYEIALRYHPCRPRIGRGGDPDVVHHLCFGGAGHLFISWRLAIHADPNVGNSSLAYWCLCDPLCCRLLSQYGHACLRLSWQSGSWSMTALSLSKMFSGSWRRQVPVPEKRPGRRWGK